MLAGQLGALSSASARDLGIKNPADLYIGMLKSQTIADALINRFHLKEAYRERTMSDTRADLAGASEIFAGRDFIINVSVIDKDPARAAALSNAYIDELSKLNRALAISEAAQRRAFYDEQLGHEKEALAEAEINLRKTQESTGLIQITDQAKMIIENLARLKAAISAKQVEVDSLRTFETEQGPDLFSAQQELSSLRRQLAAAERSQVSGNGDFAIPTARFPEAGLEYIRRLRDVKYHETLFDLLGKQMETARLDEARSAPLVQVLDPATTPDKKSYPHRSYVVIGSTLTAFVLVLLWVALGEFVRHQAKDERKRRLISQIRDCIKIT